MDGDRARVWQNLTLYESTDLVKDLYKRKHGGSMNATKAWQVASHFAQGRQYYQSAVGAGELVRPLILFYGTMTLSRGLMLFLETKEFSMAGGHGLREKDWTILDKNPKELPEVAKGLPEVKVQVDTKGTFPELCRVTENAEVCEIATRVFPKSIIRAKYTGTHPVQSGSEMTIKEILGQLPDLYHLYEETFDEFSYCLPCTVTANPNLHKQDLEGGGWVWVYETRKGIPNPKWVGEKMRREDIKERPLEKANPMAPTPETREKLGFSFYQNYKEDPSTGVAKGYDVVRSRSTGRYYLRLPAEGLTVVEYCRPLPDRLHDRLAGPLPPQLLDVRHQQEPGRLPGSDPRRRGFGGGGAIPPLGA